MTEKPPPPSIRAALTPITRDLDARRSGTGRALRAALREPALTVRQRGDIHSFGTAKSRGPSVRWRMLDGAPDPAHGITVSVDDSVTPLDYDILEYTYELDGTFRSRERVVFAALYG